MIEMLSAQYKKGDFFLGFMSLFGRWRIARACGVKPVGQSVSFGAPGSGKSTAGAIPSVLFHDGPVLVFDPKGEIARRCFERRGKGGYGIEGRGDEVHVVDPTNLTGLPRSRYNPLYEIAQERNTGRAILLIYNLCEAIIKNPGGENSWVYDEAYDVLAALVAYVLTQCPAEQCTLLTVRRLLMEGDTEKYAEAKARGEKGIEKLTAFDVLLHRMETIPAGPLRHIIAGQAATIRNMGDRQRGSVLGAVKQATKWLDLPQFQEATSTCDFLLSDFSSKKLSVFVCLPLNQLTGVAGGFMRLFLIMFTDMMYRAPHKPKAGTVLCLVDEFPQFGYINRFCAIGPTMRDFGVKLAIYLQDISQLKHVYPGEYSSFLGCAAYVQYFPIKHDETIDYLVKSLGEKLIRERTPEGPIVTKPYPLLDREQAMRYLEPGTGNQIVVRGNRRPLRLKILPYHELAYWLYSPDPRFPEPAIKAWLRQWAIARQASQAAVKKLPPGSKSCPA